MLANQIRQDLQHIQVKLPQTIVDDNRINGQVIVEYPPLGAPIPTNLVGAEKIHRETWGQTSKSLFRKPACESPEIRILRCKS